MVVQNLLGHPVLLEVLCNIQFSLLEKQLGKQKEGFFLEVVNKESKCTFAIKKPPSSSNRLSIFNHVPFLHDVFLVLQFLRKKKQECIKSRSSRNAEVGINAIFIMLQFHDFFIPILEFQCC